MVARLSLKTQGIMVLSIPLAALLVALGSMYRVEGQAQAADRATLRAYATRAEALRLRMLAQDPSTTEDLIYESLGRLSSLVQDDPAGNSALARIRSAAADRQAVLQRLAPLDQSQDQRLLRAAFLRDTARQRLSRTLIVCGVLGPLGAMFLHFLMAGRLVNRLGRVQENARRLAQGLPLDPLRGSGDEIAALERQIEDAANRLNTRERELRESETRYLDLFNRAPVPYEETDREGVIRRFNQEVCQLLKCGPDRVLGSNAWEFVAPDQREPFRHAMMERMAAGEESPPFECEYLLEDGSRIVVEIRESLIRNEAGEVTGVCCSLLDVTERKLAAVAARKVAQYAMELRNKNEQLAHALDAARSATAAKSRFLASVSHELRTPLNGIIGFSELLFDGKIGEVPEAQHEILGDILSSARHLLQLISDILDLSKVEAGRMEFRPETSELDPLVQEVRDVLRPLADRKNIRLSADVPAGFRAVLDRSRFKQVLYNYLSNAVKFTPHGGNVTVRIVPATDSFRLEVEDSGIGIPTEEISKLFQDFQQLSTSGYNDQGTGLGLALTRHIVEAQGGTVGVHSVPGAGSLFSATLPIQTCATRRVS